MIAVDTNILVYAHRAELPFFDQASKQLRGLAEGGHSWAIPWPCVAEFYSVVTNARVVDDPTPPEGAIAQLDAWMESPTLVLLSETTGSWLVLRSQLVDAKIIGRRAHDARIAALCLAHGVRELWTVDRDYSRFPTLPSRNPLVGAA